ncbi:MAG: hypothetical protein IJV87_09245 [Clostridia bacterium]|nr:hypothetical protein [Clostridia bacterium]
MENRKFKNYCLLSFLGVLLASCYPIYMGVTVIVDMIRYGTVYAEDYPKYIIPYTPIALALLIGVALMPVAIKYFKKYALLLGTVMSAVLFFVFEFILERTVTVTRTVTGVFSTLEDWQMYMCYISPGSVEERTWTEVDVLMGEYSPAFKLHFYIISIVLIISVLNCFYGFAKMIRTGDRSRCKPLIIQSVASGAFLGMCIWACFTAFYRNGDIKVSALSAVLMSVFFVLFGVTVGIYVVSFTLNKKPALSVGLPSISASVVTLIMYVGEMILLSGHLYRFGDGFFFEGIPGIVLAPTDIVIIIASGAITAIIANAVRNQKA